MKRLVILFPIFLSLAFFGSVRAVDTVEIKLATILPADTSGHQGLMEMRDAWQKASGGSVKLTLYPGSGDGEIQLVKKMRAGQLHAALVSAVGLGQIDRSVTALQIMPLAFRDWKEVDYVREKVRSDLEARLREKGFEVLFWADAGWVRFFSKEAAKRPSDFKPMKMWVWSGEPHQLTILRNLGYQPVGLETEQILPALSTGMVNVVPVPPFLANALQYNRYVGHMVDMNWVPIVGAAVVRRDRWEKIPPAMRPALIKSADATGAKFRLRARQEDEEAIVAMKKRGLVVNPVSPQAALEWQALAEEVNPQIRGNIVPADLFDRVKGHVSEYRNANGTAKP